MKMEIFQKFHIDTATVMWGFWILGKRSTTMVLTAILDRITEDISGGNSADPAMDYTTGLLAVCTYRVALICWNAWNDRKR